MAVAQATGMGAAQRRFLYGLNVALTVALALALVYVAIWIAARVGGRVDLTQSGVNSLTPRTRQLVSQLDKELTITALYTTALKEIRPHAEAHKARVADLLSLYEASGRGRITARVIDPTTDAAEVKALLDRLRNKTSYKDEAAPHAKLIAEFPDLNQRILAAVEADAQQIQALAQGDPRLLQMRELAIIARNFQAVREGAQALEAEINELLGAAADLPRYGQAVELIKQQLRDSQTALQTARDWMTSAAGQAQLAPESVAFFQQAPERYGPLLDAVAAMQEEAETLERVKLEEISDSLTRGQTILVETDDEAQVLSENDVWTFRDPSEPAGEDGDPRKFAGESAVSSAILRLTQKEKTAVVFTRFGGQPLTSPNFAMMNPMQPPQVPFGGLRELLEKENFVVEEWDVQASPAPPAVEGASRSVYVVLAPDAPQSANPMQPPQTPPISPEQKSAITGAVEASGMGLFLVSWTPGGSQFMPGPATYEFAEYLKATWGIDVRYTHLVMEFIQNPSDPSVWVPASRSPQILTGDVLTLTDHEITQPIQSYPVGLDFVTPTQLMPQADRPEGVRLSPLIETRDADTIWAITDVMRFNEDLRRRNGTKFYAGGDGAADLPSPFVLAVAAERSGDSPQRAVVIGSERFASDQMLQQASIAQVGGGLQLVRAYPGNADLFINSIHWLTGNANRISAGASGADVPRLTGLKDDGWLTFSRVFLVGLWPATALLAGAVAWLARRR